MIRIAKIILGVIFFLLGIVGLLLPILPGWALIFAGIMLIYPERGKRIVQWLEEKIKKIRKKEQ